MNTFTHNGRTRILNIWPKFDRLVFLVVQQLRTRNSTSMISRFGTIIKKEISKVDELAENWCSKGIFNMFQK